MSFLTSGLESIFWFVVVLGVMIFVHEFGHYAISKILGVTVEVFSLGFGPRLWGRKIGETDYRVSLLPLGGYVRLKGENPDDPLTGDKREFLSRPKWQRGLIFVMGPVLNVILAVGVLAASFMSGISVDASLELPPVVEWIEEGSPAAQVDIRPGDRIVKVDGHDVANWGDVQLFATLNGGEPLPLVLERSGTLIERTVTPRLEAPDIIPRIGLRPLVPAVMSNLEKGAPAAKAGFESMDQIVRINDTPIQDIEQAIRIIHGSPGKPLTITVRRDGKQLTETVTPESRNGQGIIGFMPYYPEETLKLPVVAALRKSFETNFEQAFLLFRIVKLMAQGEISVKNVSGPIEIAKFSREAARSGTLLPFIAFISLQLGIINLLPIPVLDGGHLFILLLEGVSRRDFSLKVKERIMQFGFVLLILIMVLVIANDLSKVAAINRILPSR